MSGNTRLAPQISSAMGEMPIKFSRWVSPGVAIAAILVMATALTGYLLRDPLGDFFSTVRDGTFRTLGLGAVPAALWLAVFLGAVVVRRSWFHRANLWLGALALVPLSLGIFAFFQPLRGALAGFTLYGDVSLGGQVGDSIIGSSTFQGVLRLLGIFLAGAAATAPSLAGALVAALGKLAVFAYVFLFITARGIAEKVGSGRRASAKTPKASDSGLSTLALSGSPRARRSAPAETVFGTYPTLPQWKSKVPLLGDFTPDLPLAPTAQTEVETERLGDGAGHEPASNGGETVSIHPAAESPDYSQLAESHLPAQTKFNKLWTSFEYAHDDKQNGVADAVDSVEATRPTIPDVLASEWSRPSIDLLQQIPEGGITGQEMEETAEGIKQTLAEYNIEVEVGQVSPGPTVTMYGLIPGWVRRYKQVKEKDEDGRPRLDDSGRPVVIQEESKTRVKVDSILSREKDLALALKTPSIRIETPVMGESLLGIEVPNASPSVVSLRSIMDSEEFAHIRPKAHLPVALGKGSGGEAVVIDLAKMPHLLIAGATGSGKSVCINAIISCLITEKTPAELRLLLIDPKRVELTPYNGIPHLLTPVVVETDRVVGLLKGMIREMLDRYRRMEELGVRNIEAYNEEATEKMPFLVVAIDELADLMMSAAFDVEQSLCRLAQLGRATGIHLIVATQRPSVDVVTGLIKANFPSRISFGVTSQVDSRTILDATGADKLLGRGDMLYLPLDASRPVRVQNVFISDYEIENLVNFWQSTKRAYVPDVSLHTMDDGGLNKEEADTFGEAQDELLDKAIELGHSYSKLSTSLLQRRLRIGYPRAARLMDQLEEQGVVGPSDGSKSRDVIMNKM